MSDILLSSPLFMAVIAGPYGANDHGSWVSETSLVGMHRDVVLANIMDGQVEDVFRVIGIDLKRGICWDATSEIAMDIEDRLPPEGHRSDWEDTLGLWCWHKINRKEIH